LHNIKFFPLLTPPYEHLPLLHGNGLENVNNLVQFGFIVGLKKYIGFDSIVDERALLVCFVVAFLDVGGGVICF
jgi:hypothetical protein